MNRFGAHREPFSRGEKWLFASLPFWLAGFALSAFWIGRGEEKPRIKFPASAPLPSPNGFDLYVAAARAIRAAKPSVDPTDDTKDLLKTDPQLAKKNYSLARRMAHLKSNRAGFAIFKRALKTPSRAHNNLGFRVYSQFRQLAREKVIEANTLIMQRRWDDATTASLDTIQMGNDIARGGSLMPKLVGSAVSAIGRDPLFTDKFVPEKLSASPARAAAKRLETILAARPSYQDALMQSKWESLAEFGALVEKGTWRDLAANNPDMSTRERLSLQFLSPQKVAERISEDMGRGIKNLRKPFGAPPEPPGPKPDPISEMFAYYRDYRFQEGREIVPLQVLMLRFALRAYQLENGRFPTELKQLAPKYLKQIPTDYFASGAPFRYRLRGANYDLWSVGPDKIDDKATPIVGRNGQVGLNEKGRFPSLMEDSRGDYVAGKNR